MLDLTVMLLTCSYKDNEFIRVGYYVNNMFEDGNPDMWVDVPQEKLPGASAIAEPSKPPKELSAEAKKLVATLTPNQIAARTTRRIASDQPRVTRFPIDWDKPNRELIMPLDNSNQSMEADGPLADDDDEEEEEDADNGSEAMEI